MCLQLASRDAGGRRRFWWCLPSGQGSSKDHQTIWKKTAFKIPSIVTQFRLERLRDSTSSSFRLMNKFTSTLPHLTLRFQFQWKCCPLPTSVNRVVPIQDQVTTDPSCLHRDASLLPSSSRLSLPFPSPMQGNSRYPIWCERFHFNYCIPDCPNKCCH